MVRVFANLPSVVGSSIPPKSQRANHASCPGFVWLMLTPFPLVGKIPLPSHSSRKQPTGSTGRSRPGRLFRHARYFNEYDQTREAGPEKQTSSKNQPRQPAFRHCSASKRSSPRPMQLASSRHLSESILQA
ncbi:hypothetical protein LX32DRAFT_214534 [Colletotrichum zoysiae]|uniref:Uncharacterized protein n=1 Tax=Colletotrichum zoysiae TaxID=1216348 RepID=A0AAD9LVH5_9PEZI|nr:hypothetical protein LX32DRAFT_214534 [Colletotrichum zoysiae]